MNLSAGIVSPGIGCIVPNAIHSDVCRTRLDSPNSPMDITKETMVASMQCPKERRRWAKANRKCCRERLDLMVLKTLYAMGPLHGFGIARRIEQVSDGVLDLNEGTVYTALLQAAAAGMDRVEVGNEREQPPGAVLLHYQAGRETTGARDRELGAGGGRHGEGAETRKAGVRRCGSCGCCGRE